MDDPAPTQPQTTPAGATPGPCAPCSPFSRGIQTLSAALTRWTGTSIAFLFAVLMIVAWGCSGPLFGFSDTWQLVMNTATSIITFLMVFLIQRAQNKDSLAIQLKLNEIVAAVNGASNRMIDVEDLSEEELRDLHARYQQLAKEVGDSVASIRTDRDQQETGPAATSRAASHAAASTKTKQDTARALGPIDRIRPAIKPAEGRQVGLGAVKPVVPAARRKRETREMP